MDKFQRSESRILLALPICFICLINLNVCLCLNYEGVVLLRIKEKVENDPHGAMSNWCDEVGVENPCSWFGVECFEGYVVVLNLKDLCLRGTLAPDIGNLVHMKSIILRNNSFSGLIPNEIANLKELEVIDLGYNNFSGHVPCSLGNNFSMTTLLLDNNELLRVHMSPEIYKLQRLSEAQVEEQMLSGPSRPSSCNELLISWNSWEIKDVAKRKLLQAPRTGRPGFRFQFPPQPPRRINPPPPSTSLPPPVSSSPSPSPSPLPSPLPSPSPSPSPSPVPFEPSPSPNTTNNSPSPRPTPVGIPSTQTVHIRTNHHRTLKLSVGIGGPLLLLFLLGGLFFYKSGRVSTVKPWATGLSGQLQRAFVSGQGVPKLKRSELEAACEDFSNVIGSLSVCTLYKGTLSSGVEIAVASMSVASVKDWPSNLESHFRKKIDTLSKVNHKNFVSLLGYCVEDDPFTRMMVLEYAPNGTLFEHLHIRESEHLDWLMRIRIAMGMAYCLEHMHQLTPPLPHRNLTSSAVYLTEDYAAKISDFIFWDENNLTSERERNLQSNIYNFGVVLFEIMTGKLPYSAGSDSLEDWASDYLVGDQPLREMVDPTLRTYNEDQLQRIDDIIKSCANPDSRQRPSMKEVCARLREVTGIGPDGAVPKLSPLWWAELEILSTEATS